MYLKSFTFLLNYGNESHFHSLSDKPKLSQIHSLTLLSILSPGCEHENTQHQNILLPYPNHHFKHNLSITWPLNVYQNMQKFSWLMAMQGRLEKQNIRKEKTCVANNSLLTLSFFKRLLTRLIYIHDVKDTRISPFHISGLYHRNRQMGQRWETGKCAVGRYHKQTGKLTERGLMNGHRWQKKGCLRKVFLGYAIASYLVCCILSEQTTLHPI